MQEPTRLIAVRHGETAWNVDTRIQGHLDVPLNAVGRAQAQALGRALAAQPLDAIYSSDLLRARETAEPAARAQGLAVTPEPGLRERNFGRFEGKTYAEIESEWSPEMLARWRQRDPDFAPPGGESLRMLRDRIDRTAAGLAARHPGGLILLVAHGGVMDVLYRLATHQTHQAPRTWALGNAAINRLLWTPEGFTLVGWADTGHLLDSSLDETTA